MKVFELVQSHYATLGITTSNQWTQRYALNTRVLSIYSLFGCALASHFIYICRIADGFMDYMVCLCSTSAGIISLVCFASIALRKLSLFECIDNAEKLLETRAFKLIQLGGEPGILKWNFSLKFNLFIAGCKYPQSKEFFSKANQQAERLTEFVFLVVVKISLQCFMLPRCIFSFGVYFFTDSGSDSFGLPVPLWYEFL